ncbi:MAG: hypothetical protein H0Z35_01580 [Thermoanaerobacteraceae bacterium]|nr:hypothetical protein [Thermoanaerobacteraceae bacterium]
MKRGLILSVILALAFGVLFYYAYKNNPPVPKQQEHTMFIRGNSRVA